jgi:hypothetical protein
VSTNVETPILIDICGEPAQVPAASAGGLDFSYHAGILTLVAPATADGKAFEYWYIILPSQQEQVVGTELSVAIPAGLTTGNSIIEAFYG